MVKLLQKSIFPCSTICWTVVLLWSIIIMVIHAQYPGYRPPYSPMAFSPYHPARINHETLPISQAEFAQLVAESMATSRGPHHHHPPNTDQDYEGPEHWAKESSAPQSSIMHEHPSHQHYHYRPHHSDQQDSRPDSMYQPPQQHHPSPSSDHHEQYLPHMNINEYREPSQAIQSQYQPEERLPDVAGSSNVDEYSSRRAPIYETAYGPDLEEPHSHRARHHFMTLRDHENEDNDPSPHIYGGRPNNDESYHPHGGQNNPRSYDTLNTISSSSPDSQYYEQSPNNEAVQPLYRPNNPPPLAFHQDFSRQYHHANRRNNLPMYHSSPYHPSASHLHSHVHPRHTYFHTPSRHHHHSHQHLPSDHYMTASSTKNFALVVPAPDQTIISASNASKNTNNNIGSI